MPVSEINFIQFVSVCSFPCGNVLSHFLFTCLYRLVVHCVEFHLKLILILVTELLKFKLHKYTTRICHGYFDLIDLVNHWVLALAWPQWCLLNVCEMFSYSLSSFNDRNRCKKRSLFMALETRLSELEARFSQFEVAWSFIRLLGQGSCYSNRGHG